MEILNDIPSFLIFEHTTGEPSPHGFMRISPPEPREISSWQSSPAFSYSTIEPGHDQIGVSLMATSDAFIRANCGAGPGQFSQPVEEPQSIHSTKASSKRSSVPEFVRYPGAKSIAEFWPSNPPNMVDTNRPAHFLNTSFGVADQSIGPHQSNSMLHAFGGDHEHLVYIANPWINNINHNNDIHTLEPLAMSGSNTCSDGSTNSSSDGSDHRLDHLMGFVFDENETGPLDVSWLPDQHDNNSFEHYDGGVTASDTGQYSPDSGGLDARNIFGGSSLLVTCPIQFGQSSAEVGGGLAVSMSPHFQNPTQSLQEHGGGLVGKPYPNSSSSLMPSKPKLKQINNKEDRHPNRMFGEETSGPAMNPAMNPATIGNAVAGQGVEIRQDNTREFGLNPILGSPLARSESDYSEICLVHLLIAGAEAVATRDLDLASVILVRLTELVSCSGTTMQRVAAYFSEGLQSRIESCGRSQSSSRHRHYNVRPDDPPAADTLAAFRILHEVSPYIKFGHFSANQAILEAVEREQCIHIVDFEIMEGIQWPPLMQALASRKGGPPHLRISALYRPHGRPRGLATIHETGKRLAEFASSVSVPFTFNPIPVMDDNEEQEEEFGGVVKKLCKGEEALVVNCMLHLPHMPHTTASAVSAFVRAMRTLDPILLALVEEELGCSTGSGATSSFFFEALHHYSAICDSLEDSISLSTTEAPGPGPVARVLVERVFLAPRIHHTVSLWSRSSCPDHPAAPPPETIGPGPRPIGPAHNLPGLYNWHSLVRAAGFKPVPLSFHNLSQAKLLLGLYKDGFRLDERNDRLLLGWRTKPLFAASIWN